MNSFSKETFMFQLIFSLLLSSPVRLAYAQTMDETFGTNGILTVSNYSSDNLADFYFQGSNLLVAFSEVNGQTLTVRSFNAAGQSNLSFQTIGGQFNGIPFQGVDGLTSLSLKKSICHTETTSYFTMLFQDAVDAGITSYNATGGHISNFGSGGYFNANLSNSGNITFMSTSLGSQLSGNTIALCGKYIDNSDTLVIVSSDLTGNLNSEFSNDGIYKERFATLFESGYSYTIHSWVLIDDHYFLMIRGTEQTGSNYFVKLLHLDQTGSLVEIIDMTPMTVSTSTLELSYKNSNIYIRNGNTISKMNDDFSVGNVYNLPAGTFQGYEVDSNGNVYVFGNTSAPPPFTAICVRFLSNGTLDTNFGTDGYLSYSTDTSVDGVAFSKAIIANDALYLSGEIGDIGTPSGSQDVLVVKYGISTPTAIIEDNDPYFEYYPNPVIDMLSIRTIIGGELQIISNDGRIVKIESVKGDIGRYHLNVSDLIPGLYYIQLRNHERFYSSKFIKQ